MELHPVVKKKIGSTTFKDRHTSISLERVAQMANWTAETGTEFKPVFNIEDRIPEATINALRAKGYEITIVKDDDGRVNGVMIDPATGFRLGGADPREMGYHLGW
jgi:gamma-glutamyltranspeptidase